jgi:hypothetical protein
LGYQVAVLNNGAILKFNRINVSNNGFIAANIINTPVSVRGAGNGGGSTTLNVTDLDFTEVEDVTGSWSGTQFTAPETANYIVHGLIRWTTGGTGSVFAYVDTVQDIQFGIQDTSTQSWMFNGTIKLEAGEVLSIRTDRSATLQNSTTQHWINIQKETTSTEHIVTPASGSTTTETFYNGTATSGDFMSISGLTKGDTYFLSGQIRLQAFSGTDNQVKYWSGASATGTQYGSSNVRINDANLAQVQTAISIIFTAQSDTIYFNKTGPNSVVGNGTTDRTFAQVTNLTRQFLAAVPIDKVAYVKDKQSAGVAGGGFTAGSFLTRTLNTLSGDTEFISLSSNQFTLEAGKYVVSWSAPAYNVDEHKTLLRDVTNSVNLEIGSSEYTSTSGAVVTKSIGETTININSSTTYEIQHRCQTTQGTNGFGIPRNMGVSEVYTQVKIEKLR